MAGFAPHTPSEAYEHRERIRKQREHEEKRKEEELNERIEARLKRHLEGSPTREDLEGIREHIKTLASSYEYLTRRVEALEAEATRETGKGKEAQRYGAGAGTGKNDGSSQIP